MTDPRYNLSVLQDLLTDEDPLEIAHHLDDVLYVLVAHSEYEGHLSELGHRYYLIRALRNTFLQIANPGCYGNPRD